MVVLEILAIDQGWHGAALLLVHVELRVRLLEDSQVGLQLVASSNVLVEAGLARLGIRRYHLKRVVTCVIG